MLLLGAKIIELLPPSWMILFDSNLILLNLALSEALSSPNNCKPSAITTNSLLVKRLGLSSTCGSIIETTPSSKIKSINSYGV